MAPDASQPAVALLAEMAQRLQAEPDLEQTLAAALEYAVAAVGADDAGVLLVHSGSRIESVAATAPVIEKVDQLQLEVAEGPCLSAFVTDRSYRIADTLTETRWPTWSSLVVPLGIRSVIGVQLGTATADLGALNLFGAAPEQFGDEDVAVAQFLADHVSVALAHAKREANLALAVDSRTVIGQAQGILMERYSLDPQQAFSVLRRYSQDRNIKLRQVAEEVIGGHPL